MRILVVGGAGFIGSHTCKALANDGHSVMVYDNLSTGHRDFIRWGDFIHGDIRDAQSVRKAIRIFKPDGIIHFAASINVGESVANPGKYFANNVGGTLSILEAMRDEGTAAIVVSGTCAVYGYPATVPISEETPENPINPYGSSKLFMERMLKDFNLAHGHKWISLRYFNAAGSSPDYEIGERHDPETHLIPRVMFAAKKIIPAIDVFGNDYPTADGTCIRDYIHVDDLADAHIRAMKYLLNGGESQAINLGTGKGYSVREIIEGVKNISGQDIPVRFQPRRPGDAPCLIADASRAEKVLGWKPKRELQNMLEDAWGYMVRRN